MFNPVTAPPRRAASPGDTVFLRQHPPRRVGCPGRRTICQPLRAGD
jgi:hypothetical protein